MKRLIAYITVTLSILLGILVSVIPSFKLVNGTGDYSSGRQYVFKISNKNYELSNEHGTTDELLGSDEDKQDILDSFVDEFKIRLSNADITDYKLETSGFDTIKVTFKAESSLYDQIASYLSFSWSFKASTYKEDVFVGQDAIQINENSGKDNFFDEGSARIEYRDNYPYVVIKLKDPEEFKNVYTTAKNAKEGESTASLKSVIPLDETDEETEEETTANINKIYILNDWRTGMSIESFYENEENAYLTNDQIKNHILYTYDTANPQSIFWDYDDSLSTEEQENKVYEEIYFGGYNLAEGTPSIYGTQETDRVLAYKKANLWMNKFNSKSFEYGLTIINVNGQNSTSSLIEPFLDYLVYMNQINWGNSLIIASLIALIIVSLFLILHYGLNGVSAIINSFGIFIVSIGLFNLFGSQFNVGAILGLLSLMVVSIFSSIIYFKKSNSELYLGKNIKKANQEGSKKSFMIQLDISIITLILGITSYLIPTSNLISFGSILIVGSILNIVINGALLRALTWLLYNSSFIAKNLNLIGVNKDKIPNLSKDEKPTYFDSYKKKEPKKLNNIVGISASLLLLASIIGLTTFSFTRGNIYNTQSTQNNTEVVIRIDEQNVVEDDSNKIENEIATIDDVFENKVFANQDKKKIVSDLDIKSYNYSYLNNNVTNKEYYYIVTLNGIYNFDDSAYYLNNDGVLVDSTIEEAIKISLENILTNPVVTINETYDVNNDSNNWYAFLFVAIGISVTSIYILLRFGLSKMLTSVIIIGGSLTITVGLFSLISAPFTSVITLGTLLLTLFGYIVIENYFAKEKEIYLEKRRELTDLNLRREQYEYQINEYYSFNSNVSLIVGLMIVSMFFTESLNIYLLILILIGMLIILFLSKSLLLKLEFFFIKTFNSILKLFNRPNKKHKNKNSNKKDGPEEAIFIGIND